MASKKIVRRAIEAMELAQRELEQAALAVELAEHGDIDLEPEPDELVVDTCSYIYSNPGPGQRGSCPKNICDISVKYCFQHACHDPKVKWPRCKRGKVYQSHKRGVHPFVCWRRLELGLCYFCLDADQKIIGARGLPLTDAPEIAVAAISIPSIPPQEPDMDDIARSVGMTPDQVTKINVERVMSLTTDMRKLIALQKLLDFITL